MNYSDKYLALMGMWPKRVPHWEHWSNPDAESYLRNVLPEAVKYYLDYSANLTR